MSDLREVKSALDAGGQSHLYKYWNDLSSEDKKRYLKELVSLKLDRINDAYKVFAYITQ